MRIESTAEKSAHKGPFSLTPKSLPQLGLNRRCAMRGFPLFQNFVIAAFGLDNLAYMRVFIDYDLTGLA